MVNLKGIDVSHHQGNINWAKVKESGIEFAILKAGGSDAGAYKDSKFDSYYAAAVAEGIPVGSYYFVGKGCISRDAGVTDARRFIEILKGKKFEFPVFIDLESTSTSSKTGATDAVIAFCETMETSGYFVGIYASDISGFKDRLNLDRLDRWTKWVARYGSKPKYVQNYGMWQKSETGKISGISGNVDLDECYIDYPKIIKESGKNGFTASSENQNNSERLPYIPGMTASDVQRYLKWCADKGAGNYQDTEEEFRRFLKEIYGN